MAFLKKILFSLIIFLGVITPVYASDNHIYFKEIDDKIYYDGKFGNDLFMNHTDMIPGSSFTDNILLENDTKKSYSLFLKVEPKKQSVEADELLDNIYMKIYLDNKLIYNGKAKGLDYNNDKVNLNNAIKLGDMKGKDRVNLKVETVLDSNYDNKNNTDVSYIDWVFYAQYDKSTTQIIEVPDTYKKGIPFGLISIICVIVGFIMISISRKKKDN